jgi:hypothetical protein
MKSIDEFITNILEKEINTPVEYEQTIQNAMEINNNSKILNLFKTIISILIGILATSGIVFAGYITYETIWKKPQEIMSNDFEITNEDESNVLEDIILEEKAIAELEKLGYKKITIREHEIIKDTYYSKLYYRMAANPQENNDELNIMLDAKSGDFISFGILNKENQPTQYRSTIDDVKETAKKLLLDLNLITNEYKITKVSGNFMEDNTEKSSSYQVWFAKEYDGIINNYQEVCIEFIPVINKIILLNVANEDFNNNPIEINENDAKKIAEDKNSILFKELAVDNIDISLGIEKMNEKIYIQENGIDEKTTFEIENGETIIGDKYKKDLMIRKVYKIKFNYKENADKYIYTEYFVDTTTGEIIGGKIEHLKEMIQ